MNKIDNLPSQHGATPRIPIWKSLLLIATMAAAALCILMFNVLIGGALFIAAIAFQTYGGFSAQGRVAGESTGRVAHLVFAWIACLVLAASLQYLIPQFSGTLSAFGSDLPWSTMMTVKLYPATLLAPLIIAMVWHFWPKPHQRLRVAVTLCWLSSATMMLMFGSMYLPIFKLCALEINAGLA